MLKALWVRVVHEWDTTLAGIVVGPLVTILINALEAESHSTTIPPWVAQACGVAVVLIGMLAPSFSKAKRAAAAKMLLALLVIGGMLAAPSLAQAGGFGVVCLRRCPESTAPQAPNLELPSTMWLAPSVGVTVSTYDGITRQWTTGVLPVLAESIYWRPAGWAYTDSLLALGLSASAGVDSSSGAFEARLEPVVTLANYLTLGAGYRWSGNAHGPVYSVGITLPTGVP